MPEIPPAAVRAAAHAIGQEYVQLPEDDPEAFAKSVLEALAVAALEATAPLIAEHIASQFRDRAGRFEAVARSMKGPGGESLNLGQIWDATRQAMELEDVARVVQAVFPKGEDRDA
ncbi:hypothetical protein [Sphaerisporangium sp. TRM90804]|uniref:hypothetical protein n=1 Tax=Sphaerisporangium sp. TRM90804 TaxID=3031113 RepID=UPI00244A5C8F|nr:hypothetical protein [Sphaerisporangium sp. TRM90804]MDH2424800.1 hypothetical protein [Sphaerisporangium sp. TRM90804]